MLRLGKSAALIFCVFFLYSAPGFAATSIPFTINLSKAVNVTGTPRIALDVGGITPPRYATYTSGSGTSTLIFTYTMVAGDVDLDGISLAASIDLNGGTIKDLAGNDLSPLTFTAPNTTNVKVNYPSLGMDFVYDADGRYTLNGTVYNDLISFLSAAGGTFTRASVGTYYDITGALQTAASGVPRFDYNPITHAAKGVLIEESRTNLLTKSEEFDDAIYAKTGVSITPNILTAPNGTMTADKMIEGAAGSFHNITYTVSLSSNVLRTVSIYAKAGERNWIRIQADDGNTTSANANFDLSAGVVGNTSVGGAATVSSSISPAGNGWYKCMMTYTLTSATTTRIIYILRTGDGTGTSSYSGNGTSGAYFWGAQLEQGAFATSYIPTTTATVTRAADVLMIPAAGWYTSTKGTFYGQYFLGNTSTNARAVSISSGAAPFTINNPVNSAQWRNWSGASGPTATSPIIPTFTTAMKAAAAWDDTGPVSTISASGSAVVTGTYTAGAYNGTSISVGAGSGAFFLDAPIRQLKYYPIRVSDTQLQLLTQ